MLNKFFGIHCIYTMSHLFKICATPKVRF
jgi:hypothetical protein